MRMMGRLGSLCVLATVSWACAADRAPRETPIIEPEELTVLTRAGADESGDELGVVAWVVDAALTSNGLVVVDPQPPFARQYDRQGRYAASFARRGNGPGEMGRPLSVASSPNQLVIAEDAAIHVLDHTGELLELHRIPGSTFRGATPACGRTVALISAAGFEQPGALVSVGSGQVDTLATLANIRGNSRRIHPFFAAATVRGVIAYTEEISPSRLLELSCEGDVLREVPLDSVGRQEHWVTYDDGTFGLYPAEPPLPSGLAMVADDIVWAARIVDGGAGKADSLTLVTVTSPTGEQYRVKVRGWFVIHDGRENQLVVSHTDPVPQIAIVDGAKLVEFTKQHGSRHTLSPAK